MSEQDFSQFGEQAAILAWADRTGCRCFLDLGAYDGQTFSNTAALALRGVPGVCVEAAPDQAARCSAFHDADRVQTVLAAVTAWRPAKRLLAFYWTPEQPFSSLIESQARGAVADRPETCWRIFVPGFGVDELAELCWLPRPLFVSVDLEGTSVEVGIAAARYADLLCVEAHAGPERECLLAFFAIEGWAVLLETEVNVIAARLGHPLTIP